MKHKTLFWKKWVPCLLLGILLTSCPGGKDLDHHDLMQDGAAISHHKVDFTAATPQVLARTGNSIVKTISLESAGATSYDADRKAVMLGDTETATIDIALDFLWPTMFQIALDVDFGGVEPDASIFSAEVNGKPYQFTVLESFDYNSKIVALQIPEQETRGGINTVKISENTDGGVHLESIMILPQKLISSDGSLTTTLYTQFGETDLLKGTDVGGPAIWTRAYGLSSTMEMIPGPTLYYHSGDLLNVKIVNLLNPDSSQALRDYEAIMAQTLNHDETLAQSEVRGELNIPHNLNNTNLHVHGLHVDPSKDDVTIVIVPEGADSTGYDAPHTHSPVDNQLELLNDTSVSDQGIKGGKWLYSYKIPKDHLPGTHWFHPHKHGSTSAQVENGLAGTMVIMERDTDAIVPFPGKPGVIGNNGQQTGYDLENWRGYHDRVLAIQEITNYGLQQGNGNGKGKIEQVDTNDIDLTVNGYDSLVLKFTAGQLERWRFVNAGTNHRAFSHLWMGRNTHDTFDVVIKGSKKQDSTVTTIVYEPAPMYMVAADGITLPQKDTVTASKPALLAPGNRSDFLVQLDTGEYVVFKNYKPKDQNIAIRIDGEIVYTYPNAGNVDFLPAVLANQGQNNAFLFPQTGTTAANYTGFTRPWWATNKAGRLAPIERPITPLIKVKERDVDGYNLIDVDFADSADFNTAQSGLFTPINVNDGSVTDAELMWIKVIPDTANSPVSPLMPTDAHLKSIAPVTSGKAPSYASMVDNDEILQSRPVIFDVSGTAVNVIRNDTTTKVINQFTLNGRFFELNDGIGDPKGPEKMAKGYGQPKEFISKTDQRNITDKIEFINAKPIQWKTNKVDTTWYFTNPGYYQGIKANSLGGDTYFSFDGVGAPNWKALTGLDRNSIPNEKALEYQANKDTITGLPIAQTGEEWVLINNSDVSHPFHIHINPFFIVEVGQLSFEGYKASDGTTKYDWFMRAVTAEGNQWPQRDAMPSTGAVPGSVYQGEINVNAIVGNWWDTIVVPSHGYVKVRYWFNVPEQSGEGTGTKVTDDVNRTGIWVYHCHILRHEDRGMMMPVITQKNSEQDD